MFLYVFQVRRRLDMEMLQTSTPVASSVSVKSEGFKTPLAKKARISATSSPNSNKSLSPVSHRGL